jgi:acyl-CoA reductase-like NAD-dependent aldehyde dehydrogenase
VILKKCWESYRQVRYSSLDERKKIVQNIANYFR